MVMRKLKIKEKNQMLNKYLSLLAIGLLSISLPGYALDLWDVYTTGLKKDAGLQVAQQQFLVDQQTAIEGKAFLIQKR